MDISGPQSISLDIELDSDVRPPSVAISCQDDEKESISLFSFNSPPPYAWDLVPPVPKNISITSLPENGLREIELCLNPPSRGSMLNWEYVAAEFGFSNSKIMHLRTSVNPAAEVLREIAHYPLKNLLDALAKINRVDVLLSLQSYLEDIIGTSDAETLRADSGKYDIPMCSTPSSDSFIRPSASDTSIMDSNQKFILVTHHEFVASDALRKNYKWFLKNLRKQAKQANMSAFDIDDYLEKSCQFEGLHTLFADASSIVCVFTNDYSEMLKSTEKKQSMTVKQYLHKLMNAEFMDRGTNQRFSAVIFQGTERDVLPLGWARSTLVYEFPANHVQLFKKLFM